MTKLRETEGPAQPLAATIAAVYREWFSGRRGLVALAGVAVLIGIALNWSWLVAAGIAPLLIAVLPCLAMCGLGLCMNRMAGQSCESSSFESSSLRSGVSSAPSSAPMAGAASAGATRTAVRRIAKRRGKRSAPPNELQPHERSTDNV